MAGFGARRLFLAGLSAAVAHDAGASFFPALLAAQPAPPGAAFCPACDGMRYLPLPKRAPFVWVEGQPCPPGREAVPHTRCLICDAGASELELTAAEDERLKSAEVAHRAWERDTGFTLTRVETRHAVIHAQLPAKEAAKLGQAFERLHAELQRLFGSMRLSVTRPANYELMALFGKSAYDRFRETMERRFTREQLGDGWSLSRDAMAWDHYLIPFFYETRQTIVRRPLAHAVCFLGGRRQMQVASNHLAPAWLQEGFAEFCEFLALRANLWRSVYNQNPGPRDGEWPQQLRQAALGKRLRPWSVQFTRELRDWDAVDYLQTFGMTAFLAGQAPKKFLSYVRLLADRKPADEALVSAYEETMDELEAACQKWILGGGLR